MADHRHGSTRDANRRRPTSNPASSVRRRRRQQRDSARDPLSLHRGVPPSSDPTSRCRCGGHSQQPAPLDLRTIHESVDDITHRNPVQEGGTRRHQRHAPAVSGEVNPEEDAGPGGAAFRSLGSWDQDLRNAQMGVAKDLAKRQQQKAAGHDKGKKDAKGGKKPDKQKQQAEAGGGAEPHKHPGKDEQPTIYWKRTDNESGLLTVIPKHGDKYVLRIPVKAFPQRGLDHFVVAVITGTFLTVITIAIIGYAMYSTKEKTPPN